MYVWRRRRLDVSLTEGLECCCLMLALLVKFNSCSSFKFTKFDRYSHDRLRKTVEVHIVAVSSQTPMCSTNFSHSAMLIQRQLLNCVFYSKKVGTSVNIANNPPLWVSNITHSAHWYHFPYGRIIVYIAHISIQKRDTIMSQSRPPLPHPNTTI